MKPVTIVLMGEPAGKGRPRATRAGHVYTPEKSRSREGRISDKAEAEMNGDSPIEGPVRLELLCEFAIPRSISKLKQSLMIGAPCAKRPDFDNLAKLAADALNGIVYLDDKQITEARVLKVYGVQPKMVLTIIPL